MAVLVWRCGNAAEKRLELKDGQSLTVGRQESCDIVLAEDQASRQHARIHVKGSVVEIEDLDSSNGTLLAGRKISKKITWQPGQAVKIGGCQLDLIAGAAQDLSQQKTVVLDKGISAAAVGQGGAAKSGKKKSKFDWNFISRHWRGEYSLGRSIFINSVLLNIPLFMGAINLLTFVGADGSPNLRLMALTAITAFVVGVLIWQIVGIWRSIRGAKERGAWLITRIAAGLFLLVPVALIVLEGLGYQSGYESLRAIETGLDNGGRAAYSLQVDQNVLVFNGPVTWPLIEDFRGQLEQNPQINTILLRSPGGDTTASRRINDILRAKGVTTVVTDVCASACTVIFAAGRERVAGPNAQIGFHAAAIIAMDEMMTRIMNAFTLQHDELNAQYYRQAGFAEDFILRAITTPSVDLWVPTIEQLVQAGVVTRVLPRN